jgi:hypothetical protein
MHPVPNRILQNSTVLLSWEFYSDFSQLNPLSGVSWLKPDQNAQLCNALSTEEEKFGGVLQ